MSLITIQGCGSSEAMEQKHSINVATDDFSIETKGNRYRFDVDKDGKLIVALINGVDIKIITCNGYPAICLYHNDI